MTQWTWISDQSSPRADRLLTLALETDLGVWEGEKRKVSRSLLQKWMNDGQVKLVRSAKNYPAKTLTASDSISVGDQIEIVMPDPESLELIPEDRPIEILYEDTDLLVVNKPPNLTVHPSSTQTQGTLVHALLHHIKDLSGIGGVLRPGIVHRIDKDTSGALVITKTDAAHIKLSETFSKHQIQREYWALVYGSPEWGKNPKTVESLIGRSPHDRIKMSMEVKTGKKAVTHFRCEMKFGDPTKKPFAAWVIAKLETGRTHQVRVHLAGIQHSILGDPLYGTPTSQQAKWLALPADVKLAVEQLPGQALHAASLGFHHPISGQWLEFKANPPLAFQSLLDTLKTYS
jgi:23S rRNA pseudouridine1911/1915/1917 synthase